MKKAVLIVGGDPSPARKETEQSPCMKETLLPDACGNVERGGEVNEKERGIERENGLFPFVLFSNLPFAHLP